ncbi:RNA 3'-terminal phosphate cyclase (ATP) [Pseudomonas delhiensis]|uniref:RNA 3'-terminal phosphate cyclase n=1 Tax=Pseudomonas delhiensis TaxID=366289 RepID=A0A239HQT9_9PSED|nr:RNA 3'-terminal phosphate cyclase [Pseudomonas delhiensis]SDI47256.1 RNA 3'-terminal phosphate cyclase (ATP) [Pseudomonas delhiensis]SNS83682.1 RNA 3'-terminal phosphate cyclase (ATP) [Pseudomonas delhiensis]
MNKNMIELDGAEGGGQILRSALSLAMITGKTLRIVNIRGRRSRPGLLRQHLTAVRAAAKICGATVEGAELGSLNLTFRPGAIRGGDYHFSIGSAGSAVLVLQAVLPALLYADGPSSLSISGGTHNPLAPPADFIEHSWLPLLRRMGAKVDFELLRHGFMPAGGGELAMRVEPGELQPLHLPEAGTERSRSARALLAAIPGHVADRELERVRRHADWHTAATQVVRLPDDQGPGNALLLEIECEHLNLVFCAFGQSGVSAERVASQALRQAADWCDSGTSTEEHLADQLLLPMALAGGGSFTTPALSDHLLSNRAVIEAFLPARIDCEARAKGGQYIHITPV